MKSLQSGDWLDNMITLYHGDMLVEMDKIPDGSVDLVVTDPPYGMDYQSGWRINKYEKIKNDVTIENDIHEWITQIYRVLKENTGLYMFCSWHKIDIFKQAIESRFTIKNIIVWNKNNHGSGDLEGSYAPKHEFIIYAHKGRLLNKGERHTDVLNFDRVDGTKSVHPTQKPTDLLGLLIKNSTNEHETVLDPFMGSGTTGIACDNTDRRFIGIELDENYFNIAKKRIEKNVKQFELDI